MHVWRHGEGEAGFRGMGLLPRAAGRIRAGREPHATRDHAEKGSKRGQSYEIMFCCSAPFSPFLLSSMNFAFFLQGVEWGGRIFRFVIVAPVGRGAVDPMAGPIGTGYRKSKYSVVCHPCGFVFIRG